MDTDLSGIPHHRWAEVKILFNNEFRFSSQIEITNLKQFPMTEMGKSKQYLALEGFGH